MSHRVVALAVMLAAGGCVRRPPPLPAPPEGALALDAERPFLDAVVGGVPLRLRVDPGQWGVIELNPAAAARMGARWEADRTLQIGRITLAGRSAQTTLLIAGRTIPVLMAEHGRVAIGDADGVIGADVLPFAEVIWRRTGAPAATSSLTLPLELGSRTGLTATPPDLPLAIRLRFSLMRPTSEATAAAGSLLAQLYGGMFEGDAAPLPVLFGISRPARSMRFARPPLIAGFRFVRVAVRIADFRGDNPLPTDPVPAGEIVVAGKDRPQRAESWVTLAADRLRACGEIRYRATPRSLTLACAFDP